jgi:hypothetical protein
MWEQRLLVTWTPVRFAGGPRWASLVLIAGTELPGWSVCAARAAAEAAPLQAKTAGEDYSELLPGAGLAAAAELLPPASAPALCVRWHGRLLLLQQRVAAG